MLKHKFFSNFIKYSLIGFGVGIFISLNIFTVSSFTEPTGAPGVTEPTDETSRGAIHTLLGVTNSVTANTVTIFNFLRQVYTNVGGTPSSVTGYTSDGGGVNDLIGTSTPDTANGKTAFNYLKLINDALDFPSTSNVISSDTVKGVAGDISDCTNGDASCYANSGKWYSAECADSTTGTKTSCYVDDTAKYIDAGICSAASNTGYCYINTATLSAMDTDLTAAKIKSGEIIFGVTGSY